MYGFRITASSAPARGTDLRFAGLGVEHAGWLPAVRLEDRAGALFGVLIGWPIAGDTWAPLGGVKTFPSTPTDLAAFHRAELEPLRGSWVAIVAGGGARRVYLDPFGSLSAVYDPAAGLVGGTAADIVAPAEYSARFDAPLHAAFAVSGDGWFPAGLTAHRGIARLLVNHYLDLDRFAPVRHNHWSEVRAGSGSVDAHLETLAGEVRGVAMALAKTGRPLAIGLTGGADSRLMLAALRGATDNVLFYTVDAPGARFDRVRATELAARFGLRHRVLPYVRATPAQADAWDRRVGHAVATENRWMHPSVAPLREHACLGGLGGEVGRCFLWPELDNLPQRIDAREIVDRLKLPRLPRLEARIARWLAELPETDPVRVLDIAYIEQRMGCWGFSQSYANPRSLVLHPLGSAAALRAMLALPPEYRQNDGMVHGMIERCWPELLELPINRYGDRRDLGRRLARFARPARVWRKLRQIVRVG